MEFNKIYTQTHPKIERFVMRKIACKEDAEEIASEVFVKVHANLNEFNENLAGINTWIFTIAKNLMIDYWRKRNLDTISINDNDEDDEHLSIIETIKDEMNPLRSLESNDIGDHILDAIISLPKSISTIAEKFFIDELTYKEIASELSLPLGTVKSYIFKARKSLRNRLIAFR